MKNFFIIVIVTLTFWMMLALLAEQQVNLPNAARHVVDYFKCHF